MKGKKRWLTMALGLSVPGLLGMSGSLPGATGDDQNEIIKAPSTHDKVQARLIAARSAIDDRDWADAENNLTKADHYLMELTPHTSMYDSLSREKTKLWEWVRTRKK